MVLLLINSYHFYALCFQISFLCLFAHHLASVICQLLDLRTQTRHNSNGFVQNYRALVALPVNYASVYCQYWVSTMQLVNFVPGILNVYQAVAVRNYGALLSEFTV